MTRQRPGFGHAARSAVALALTGLATLAGATSLRADSLAVPGFGTVQWSPPSGPPTRIVLVLGGEGAAAVADALSSASTLVIRLDAGVLLRKASHGCAYPAGDLESLTELLEKRLGFPRYVAPVLAGTDSGAALAFASVAQAPVGTFPALLTVDFRPELEATSAWCAGRGLKTVRASGATRLSPNDNFAPLWVAVTRTGKAAADAAQFLAAMPSGRAVQGDVPETALPGRLRGAWARIDTELARADAAQAAEEANEFGGLPVLALPATGSPRGLLAVVLSGDGGWQGVDRKVMRELTTRGVAVAGLDSQRYLWKTRTPEEVAADLGRIVSHYRSQWSCSQVLLVGYSAGADVLTVVARALDAPVRSALRLLVLLSPSRSVRLALFTDLQPAPRPPGHLVVPALRTLQGMPILCLYGEGDRESPCIQVPPSGRAVRVAGSHAFGGDAAGIAERILAAAGPR